MSLVCSSSCVAPLPLKKRSSSSFLKLKTSTLSLCTSAGGPNFTTGIRKHINFLFREPHKLRRLAKSQILVSQESFTETSTIDMDWEDQEEIEDTGSPWEGSVMYRRNASVTHVEYCTTLERLGLGRLSTEVSKKRASAMGLRVTKDVKDYPDGTPVQVSVDVIRKKKKLRLDGIVRTVITLGCNRCGELAGFTFSNDKANSFSGFSNDKEEDEDDDDDLWIDWEDKLHFPPEVKEIDISKHIRDLVHLEITITAICDPACKGMCLKCGANLNKRKCDCGSEDKDKGSGPLGNLREQMQQKEGLKN
ncbi:putative large ribosomal RNA subunit accumulation protein YCED [Cardamine amara subsp. amara]|uniref:Large ribosomal RNA subunit accumulation protein YCED n=1 Tax=Cardamine amara subsp. amara TaxID=228776 RepID=A0ABD0ZST9_CARAN